MTEELRTKKKILTENVAKIKETAKRIESELMNEGIEIPITQNSAKTIPQDLSEYDNKMLKSVNISIGFAIVDLGNGRYRVANYRRQWISPVLNKGEASMLCATFNKKDPEQRKTIPKKTGYWHDI